MRPFTFRFYFLPVTFLLCIAAHANTDTMRVREFIDDWKQVIAEDEGSCAALLAFYSDSVNFYNTGRPKKYVCNSMTQHMMLASVLFEPGYKIEPVAGSVNTWKATFGNAPNMFGTDKYHYILVSEAVHGMLMITTHSSLADDLWLVRLNEIKTNTITDRSGKKYYVLNEDSTTFPGRRLYFLSDTLSFDEPWFHRACADTLGYYVRGKVFVAMSKANSRKPDCMRNITQELNARTFQEAEFIGGGLPCFVQKDSITPTGIHTSSWSAPELRWTKTGDDVATIRLRCDYNYGDACPHAYTTIHVLLRKKKIEVSKVMMPLSKRTPH